MITEKLIALLALKRVSNLGDSLIKRLIHKVGSPEEVLREKKHNLLKIEGIGALRVKDIHNPEHLRAAERELHFVQKNKISCVAYDQAFYPERLRHCSDGPVVLFGRGNIDLGYQKIISVVGTRKVTAQGIAFCEELIDTLAPLDPVVVSGFAYGVDICAHKAAMGAGLQTIACLAHGLNQIYPKLHKKYVSDMETHGGFFTDYWSTDTFDRKNFLGRNRIIAGLSEATIVIESAAKGGSLVTAELAHSYNRDVFAVPGRTTDPYSSGCNRLIKTQKAHLLSSAADLIYMLNWQLEGQKKKKQAVQKQLFIDLDTEEQQIHDFLNIHGKTVLDSIALQCGLPIFKTAAILLNLELKGAVRPLPGKLFELV